MSDDYTVRDITMAPEGQKKIDWVSRPMKVLNGLSEKFLKDGAFRGKKISICPFPFSWPACIISFLQIILRIKFTRSRMK